jgi:hypothetical protein
MRGVLQVLCLMQPALTFNTGQTLPDRKRLKRSLGCRSSMPEAKVWRLNWLECLAVAEIAALLVPCGHRFMFLEHPG